VPAAVQVLVAPAPPPLVQHAWLAPPQTTQLPLLQVPPVQLWFAQQASPRPPQLTHWAAAAHLPARQHPPPLQVLPAQQFSFVPPQAAETQYPLEQVEFAAVQVLPAQHA